ncbi:MAG: transposase [Silvibacterium sp.]|jgi:transposase-like protein|nr:transposase [Silvibacterium sp.]
MNAKQPEGARRRRSRAEVDRLVAEYEASGLGRQEFCQRHGLSLTTLNRHRKRRQLEVEGARGDRWVAVELADEEAEPKTQPGSELVVLLSRGRRIEVRSGFDTNVLQQLVRVLEQV